MSALVRSSAPIDAPFARAYAGEEAPPLVELGFAGPRGAAAELPAGCGVSTFLPGDDPDAAHDLLARLAAERRAFRFLYAERLYAPAIEARRLFLGRDVGTTISLLAKVQAHPACLIDPARAGDDRAWLREPVLSRVAFAVATLGPVEDARLVRTALRDGGRAWVAILRHRDRPRLSILEAIVSPGIEEGGAPAVVDRIELTGRDGFIRVAGPWDASLRAPRLALHRGSVEMIERRPPRDRASMYAAAAEEVRGKGLARQSAESYRLAQDYVYACRKIIDAGADGGTMRPSVI